MPYPFAASTNIEPLLIYQNVQKPLSEKHSSPLSLWESNHNLPLNIFSGTSCFEEAVLFYFVLIFSLWAGHYIIRACVLGHWHCGLRLSRGPGGQVPVNLTRCLLTLLSRSETLAVITLNIMWHFQHINMFYIPVNESNLWKGIRLVDLVF